MKTTAENIGLGNKVTVHNGSATWAALPDSALMPDNAYRGTGGANIPGNSFVNVANVNVPAGAYVVMLSLEYDNGANSVNTIICRIMSPSGHEMTTTRGTTTTATHSESVSLVGLANTSGGSFVVQCRSLQGLFSRIWDASLIAIQIGAAHGAVTPS